MAVDDPVVATPTPAPAPDLSTILAKLTRLEQVVAGLQPVKGDVARLSVNREQQQPMTEAPLPMPSLTPVIPEPQFVVSPRPPPVFNHSQLTDTDIRRIVREVIPVTLRHVDDNRVGNFLKLTPADAGGNTTAYWGPSESSMDVKGTEVLYKIPVLREYDANGVIVAPGDETGAEGTTLQWTIDWLRVHS